jgi:hypothetical protein
MGASAVPERHPGILNASSGARPDEHSGSGYLKTWLIEEEWGWLGRKMRYFQRPLRDLIEPLVDAGFVIERICEPSPSAALKLADPKGYDRLSRFPGKTAKPPRIRKSQGTTVRETPMASTT